MSGDAGSAHDGHGKFSPEEDDARPNAPFPPALRDELVRLGPMVQEFIAQSHTRSDQGHRGDMQTNP
ncbi:hypothetical protein E2562_021518 [Oryza meyeriana var. granulata]|uniref:Uncharacterized protein n=1 Tax=Oryza meyeriana var. granulata TaxID=110450 RepID=A0A6G1E1Q3_9ORYZ|nr:hypothetical protein E2562_021518 [Oryza meyeriana var. granulata]